MNQSHALESKPEQFVWLRILLACGCATLAACTTLPNGRGWGQDVSPTPGWSRVRSAAAVALRDPWVWAPLAGAAGMQIDGWDRRISNWARHETPVYGSQAGAAIWSDRLRSTAVVTDLATVVFTPSGDDGLQWIGNKLKGYLVDLAAASSAIGTTGLLKKAAGRTRPSGVDSQSFPSGHVSIAATYDRLAARNLDAIDMNAGMRRTLDYGLDAVTVGTAWARIEAGAHYPSDTLFSIALGNFAANFFENAFMGESTDRHQQLAVVPEHGGFMLQWRWVH